jgi:hypothetical protein
MLEGPANPSGMQRAHLKDVTPCRDEKSAEVIDKQRVVRRPSRKRVSKPLKRKDLNEKKEKMEVARGDQAGICEWQTRGRIAHKYTACKLLSC